MEIMVSERLSLPSPSLRSTRIPPYLWLSMARYFSRLDSELCQPWDGRPTLPLHASAAGRPEHPTPESQGTSNQLQLQWRSFASFEDDDACRLSDTGTYARMIYETERSIYKYNAYCCIPLLLPLLSVMREFTCCPRWRFEGTIVRLTEVTDSREHAGSTGLVRRLKVTLSDQGP